MVVLKFADWALPVAGIIPESYHERASIRANAIFDPLILKFPDSKLVDIYPRIAGKEVFLECKTKSEIMDLDDSLVPPCSEPVRFMALLTAGNVFLLYLLSLDSEAAIFCVLLTDNAF